MCLCCQQNEIKHTLSFYCRWRCGYLQQRYGLDFNDYITYAKMMYNKRVPLKKVHIKVYMKSIITSFIIYVLLIDH